ncbi:MAG TPA: hypothetical protein VGL39_24860 [Jatrophihabitantaceae bacterium]|jgi:hypothetical protein
MDDSARADQLRATPTVEQVADLLDEVYAANGLLAEEVDRIIGSRAAVSQATVERFTRLAEQLRDGAQARATLSALDPALLLAGASAWRARRRARDDATAARRAATRWSAEDSS